MFMGSLLPPEIRVASCRNAAAFYEPRNVSLGNSLKSAKYLSKQKEKKLRAWEMWPEKVDMQSRAPGS